MAISSKFAVPILDIQGGVNCERAGFTIGDAERLGTLPVVLCAVRPTSKGIRGFVRCCELRNIQVRPAGGGAEVSIPTVESVKGAIAAFGSDVFECVSKLEELEYLTGHPSVTQWGFVDRTAKRVGFSSVGAGPEKARAMPKFRDPQVGDWTKTNNILRASAASGETEGNAVLVGVLAQNKVSE